MSIVTDRAVRAQEDICQPDIGECAYQDRRTGIISVPTGLEDGDRVSARSIALDSLEIDLN